MMIWILQLIPWLFIIPMMMIRPTRVITTLLISMTKLQGWGGRTTTTTRRMIMMMMKATTNTKWWIWIQIQTISSFRKRLEIVYTTVSLKSHYIMDLWMSSIVNDRRRKIVNQRQPWPYHAVKLRLQCIRNSYMKSQPMLLL